MCDHISFPGRPDRQKYIPKSGKPVHLSSGLSGLCVREKAEGDYCYQKAGCSVGRRDENQYAVKEFEASCV